MGLVHGVWRSQVTSTAPPQTACVQQGLKGSGSPGEGGGWMRQDAPRMCCSNLQRSVTFLFLHRGVT